jgi:hypothetical protein
MGFRLSGIYKLSEVCPHYTSRQLAEQAIIQSSAPQFRQTRFSGARRHPGAQPLLLQQAADAGVLLARERIHSREDDSSQQ